MATTTNFGWTTPNDTDLVKDGASAIRTLGSAIDTSMGDLKGGTTGQVLSKNSNTDMDFVWVAQDDSNAIQNAIVDAKGDLIAASAADTPARLAVGTNGQVLTADSTAATGLAWATPSNGSMTLLSTTNVTAVSSINISGISQSYKDLFIVIDNVKPASNTYLNLNLYYGSSSSMGWQNVEVAYNGTSPLLAATITGGDQSLGHDWNSASAGRNIVTLTIKNYAESISHTIQGAYNFYGVTNGNYRAGIFGGATYAATGANAINEIRFNWQSAANFSAQGTIYIYGVK